MPKVEIETADDYVREDDGREFIAISSKARTVLGRGLAAGSLLQVNHPEFGKFKSMAGFLRYLAEARSDQAREIYGAEHDDALLLKLPPQYEEVAQHFLWLALTEAPWAISGDLHGLLRENTLPLQAFLSVDDEWIPMSLPLWYREALCTFAKRRPSNRNSPTVNEDNVRP